MKQVKTKTKKYKKYEQDHHLSKRDRGNNHGEPRWSGLHRHLHHSVEHLQLESGEQMVRGK